MNHSKRGVNCRIHQNLSEFSIDYYNSIPFIADNRTYELLDPYNDRYLGRWIQNVTIKYCYNISIQQSFFPRLNCGFHYNVYFINYPCPACCWTNQLIRNHQFNQIQLMTPLISFYLISWLPGLVWFAAKPVTTPDYVNSINLHSFFMNLVSFIYLFTLADGSI